MDNAYQWVSFYEALADKLLAYSDKRNELFELMKNVRVFGKLVFPRVEIKNSPPPGPDYCILE